MPRALGCQAKCETGHRRTPKYTGSQFFASNNRQLQTVGIVLLHCGEFFILRIPKRNCEICYLSCGHKYFNLINFWYRSIRRKCLLIIINFYIFVILFLSNYFVSMITVSYRLLELYRAALRGVRGRWLRAH